MKKIIYKADSRGHFKNEWLNSHFSFSFAEYFDRERMNFGALRVVNDDIIQPGMGFGKHPHDNMEIITIPLSGKVAHRDSMGHQQEINVDEVQVMSAGTGLFHSEFNPDLSEETSLFQIWIYPKIRNIEPTYSQRLFDKNEAQNKWQELVSGDISNVEVLHISQDAKISRIFLKQNESAEYQIDENSFGSFVLVVEGKADIAGETLSKRDTIGLYDTKSFKINALTDLYILNIEVPAK